MKKQFSATAEAVIKVKIRNLGSWGPDCTLDQINKQAADQARGLIRNNFKDNHNVLVLGDPDITVVLVGPND